MTLMTRYRLPVDFHLRSAMRASTCHASPLSQRASTFGRCTDTVCSHLAPTNPLVYHLTTIVKTGHRVELTQ
jgi:hypothetical protein